MASPPPVPFTPAAKGVALPSFSNFTVELVIELLSTPELPRLSKLGRKRLLADKLTFNETFIELLDGVELTTRGIWLPPVAETIRIELIFVLKPPKASTVNLPSETRTVANPEVNRVEAPIVPVGT